MGKPPHTNSKHIGADIEEVLAERFSKVCKQRGFLIGRVLSQFATWWVEAPEELQNQFYLAKTFSMPELKVLTTPEEVRRYVESLIHELKHSKPSPKK